VATFMLPVNTTQDAATYKASIDGDFTVAQRIIDQFAPRQTTVPAMTISLDAGCILLGTTLTEVTAQTSGTITAPASGHFRIDRAVIDAVAGTLSIITGTPTTGTPSAPAITAGNLPVAQISLSSATTTITNSIITDERNFWGNGNLSALLDSFFGNTQGDILYRDSSAWKVLAPGSSGQFLQSGGASANPSWVTFSNVVAAFAVGSYITATHNAGAVTGGSTYSAASLTPVTMQLNGSSGGVAPTGDSISGTYEAMTSQTGSVYSDTASLFERTI
jgi:hypothetical protein